MTSPPALRDDYVPSIAGIAEELYGEATPKTVRKVRHQIAKHDLPVVRRGKYISSFRSWLARWARGERVEARTVQ